MDIFKNNHSHRSLKWRESKLVFEFPHLADLNSRPFRCYVNQIRVIAGNILAAGRAAAAGVIVLGVLTV